MEGIVQQMGPKSKKESKKWRKQEKEKIIAIEKAFNTEVTLEEATRIRQKLGKENES